MFYIISVEKNTPQTSDGLSNAKPRTVYDAQRNVNALQIVGKLSDDLDYYIVEGDFFNENCSLSIVRIYNSDTRSFEAFLHDNNIFTEDKPNNDLIPRLRSVLESMKTCALKSELITLTNTFTGNICNEESFDKKKQIFNNFDANFKSKFSTSGHPVGKTIGSALFIAAGTILGAALGMVFGPSGSAAGALVGAALGLAISSIVMTCLLAIMNQSDKALRVHKNSIFESKFKQPLEEAKDNLVTQSSQPNV